jgi:maltooligosyltrehalose trehalohydrolase
LGAEAFVLRFFDASGHDRLLVVNLGSDLSLIPSPEPLLAPPTGGVWMPWWSSEDPRYGGGGAPDLPADRPWTIPAHCAVLLAGEAPSR